jgi:hypothetical protein
LVKYENECSEFQERPWVPFHPKMKKMVTKAYSDSKARQAKSSAGDRIQDVA